MIDRTIERPIGKKDTLCREFGLVNVNEIITTNTPTNFKYVYLAFKHQSTSKQK